MNAKLRNDILTAALEADDISDDTYILPGSQPTYRVAFNQGDWDNGVKTRMGSISWTHLDDETSVVVDPALTVTKAWTIDNCDCEETFRSSCDSIVDKVTDYLSSQGI